MISILAIAADYDFQGGGVTVVIREILQRLVRKGHRCTVLTNNLYDLLPEEEVGGVQVVRVSFPLDRRTYGFNPAIYRHLMRADTLSNADVVHIHRYHSLLSLSMCFVPTGKPVVFSPHYIGMGHDTLANLLLRPFRVVGRRLFRRADAVVCASAYESTLVQEDFGLDDTSIEVIPHGVQLLVAERTKSAKGCEEGVSLLYVGRVIEFKGIEHIVRAISILRRRYQVQARLHICGTGGSYKRKLHQLGDELGVGADIVFHGNLSRDELSNRYPQADMSLLLSRSESYGLVVAEALASGTPCIVAKVGALREFLDEPGCFGIEYPPDPYELAELILAIHTNEVQIGPFNTSRISTWEHVAQEYERIYYGVLSGTS